MDTTNTKSIPGKRILRSGSTSTSAEKIAIGPRKAKLDKKPANTGPSVKMNRGSDGVDTIEITCACGEQIVIRCDYDQ